MVAEFPSPEAFITSHVGTLREFMGRRPTQPIPEVVKQMICNDGERCFPGQGATLLSQVVAAVAKQTSTTNQ